MCVALAVGILGGAAKTYAGVEYISTDSCGYTWFYSTGSSAGDTMWRCPSGGGACTAYNPGVIINGDCSVTQMQ
jgi:hypothetical protein